jgi:hypothetical protein
MVTVSPLRIVFELTVRDAGVVAEAFGREEKEHTTK